jgi:hypothetical protein
MGEMKALPVSTRPALESVDRSLRIRAMSLDLYTPGLRRCASQGQGEEERNKKDGFYDSLCETTITITSTSTSTSTSAHEHHRRNTQTTVAAGAHKFPLEEGIQEEEKPKKIVESTQFQKGISCPTLCYPSLSDYTTRLILPHFSPNTDMASLYL